MTTLSMLQDPRGKGGTATAVSFYRDWMDLHLPGTRDEVFLDEQGPSGLSALRAWDGCSPGVPRVLPWLQVPPHLAARQAVSRKGVAGRHRWDETHVIGASAVHGWAVTGRRPTLVWLATTLADERRESVLNGRSRSRRIAYRTAQPILERLEGRVLHEAERVLAMSPHTAEIMIGLGIPPARVDVVVVPVDTDQFEPPPGADARRGALFVGRARDPRKGFDRLLPLLGSSVLLRARGLSVVSPGECPKVDEPMRWLGRVDDLPSVFQSAELLLLPSRQEGLGIVALEAMACGTPVVARSCGGIDQILTESGGGLVTDTAEAFESAVEALLTDGDRAREMGRAGRRWVEDHASQARSLKDPGLFRLR